MMKLSVCFLLIFCAISTYYVSAEVCAGCPTKADLNDKEMLTNLKDAVDKHNARTNAEPLKDIVVTEASKQVVAGIKYKYEYTANGLKSNKHYTCNTVILIQAWVDPKGQVLKHNCTQVEQ